MSGYRGQPFKAHADLLGFADWHSLKDLITAMAIALDNTELALGAGRDETAHKLRSALDDLTLSFRNAQAEYSDKMNEMVSELESMKLKAQQHIDSAIAGMLADITSRATAEQIAGSVSASPTDPAQKDTNET